MHKELELAVKRGIPEAAMFIVYYRPGSRQLLFHSGMQGNLMLVVLFFMLMTFKALKIAEVYQRSNIMLMLVPELLLTTRL